MNFPFFRLKPDQMDVLAGLRDRCIVAETKAVLLEDMVEHLRRPRRERRKDASAIIERRKATTEYYKARVSTLTPDEAAAARMRGERK